MNNGIGSIRWNFCLGTVALLISFLVSFGNNLFFTAISRGIMAFILFFILTFPFRMIISYIVSQAEEPNSPINEHEATLNDNSDKGSNVDWVTPAEDISFDLLRQDRSPASDEFQSIEPSELAQALRVLKDK
jgi:hypothetical protein